MKETRYNIDLHENKKPGRIGRIILGFACLGVTGWYIFSITGTPASSGSAWAATGFLMLFGLWMIASGLGYTSRYITVAEDKITLRQEFYRLPVIFTPGSLIAVEFRPLTVIFTTKSGSVSLHLGTYYPENTARIMEAVEEFCKLNSVDIRGDYKPEKAEEK